MPETVALILAAGKGTRMRTDRPKMLHEVCGVPMLEWVVQTSREAGATRVVVVVGHQKEVIKKHFRRLGVEWVDQDQQLGTGHAVMVCRDALRGLTGDVLVLCGDKPLIKAKTLADMLASHRANRAAATVLTTHLDDPTGYGRILRDRRGRIRAIVEQLDATSQERRIQETNSGIYCFELKALFAALDEVKPDNKKGEYYLTDAIRVLYRRGKTVMAFETGDFAQTLGVNSQQELAQVNRVGRMEILKQLMDEGVMVIDPESTFVERNVMIGSGTVLYPYTYIGKDVQIGLGCRIGPLTHVKRGTRIADRSHLCGPRRKGPSRT
jgi:bifunctional UDP-N-acetylglucosamine pyrophosphorylase/glucosamine-1-phosphate N-acetyltransferase